MEQKSNVGISVIGALIAAVVGGVVWAAITILTNYEIGFIAWVIGGLTAFGAAKFATKITPLHQIVSVLASLLGIVIGKYLAYGYMANGGFSGIFSSDTFSILSDNISFMFGVKDIIFVLIAVAIAWQMPIKIAANKV
ncbi:hypothetical protein D3C76_512670 [compost metagenome]